MPLRTNCRAAPRSRERFTHQSNGLIMQSHRIPFNVLILLLVPFMLTAQRRPAMDREPGEPVSVETHNFVSHEIGKSRIDVRLRVPYHEFVFVKNEVDRDSLPYSARAEISIEILDRNGDVAARKLTREEFRAAEPPVSARESNTLERLYSFDLAPATYSILLQVNDLESSRRYKNDRLKVSLKDFQNQPLEISDVLFTEKAVHDDTHEITPISSGGDIPLGHNVDAYAELNTSLPVESLHVSYDLFRSESNADRRQLVVHDTITAQQLSSGKTIDLAPTEHGFMYRLSDSSLKECRACWMHIRSDTLPEGRYELRINSSAGAQAKTVTEQFHIRWLDRPFSLRDPELAVNALEYIASEDELRKLKSADHEEQRILFNEFWKRRDTTSKTAFSPLMAEYYRRVDYVMTNFSTLRQPNGVKTDRGKAYILYGPPTSVKRDLKPNAVPQEIWEYGHLHKKFTFIDESRQGNYKLYSTGDL